MKEPRREIGVGSSTARILEVYCRRLERHLPIAEHAQCPYCFGKTEAIGTARHARFCDFKPGKDPTCFGFPEDKGRYRR